MSEDVFLSTFCRINLKRQMRRRACLFLNNSLICWSQVSCALSRPAAERLHLSTEIRHTAKWAKYEFIHISPERKLGTHFRSRLQAWAISISLCYIFVSFTYFFVLCGGRMDLFSCMAGRRQGKSKNFGPSLNTEVWPFDMEAVRVERWSRMGRVHWNTTQTFRCNRAVKLDQYSVRAGLLLHL